MQEPPLVRRRNVTPLLSRGGDWPLSIQPRTALRTFAEYSKLVFRAKSVWRYMLRRGTSEGRSQRGESPQNQSGSERFAFRQRYGVIYKIYIYIYIYIYMRVCVCVCVCVCVHVRACATFPPSRSAVSPVRAGFTGQR